MLHFKAAMLLRRTELVPKVLYCWGYGRSLNLENVGPTFSSLTMSMTKNHWSLKNWIYAFLSFKCYLVDQRVHLHNYIRAQLAQTKKTSRDFAPFFPTHQTIYLFIYLFIYLNTSDAVCRAYTTYNAYGTILHYLHALLSNISLHLLHILFFHYLYYGSNHPYVLLRK